MDIGHTGETREPGPDPTRCPSCGVPYRAPIDQRYGYCWEEHDFMGEPLGIVLHGDEEFYERVRDKMLHMPPRPIRVMTDEERDQMWADNLVAFREHERWAVSMMEPGTALIGAVGLGARLYEPVPTRWQRVRGWLLNQWPSRARGGEVPVRIDEHQRMTLTFGASPGARLLSGEDAVDHVLRRPQTWRQRLRARLSARR